MDSLPTEVLVLVFEYLRVGEILACIKVCRRWNDILSGHETLLSGKACVLKCTNKTAKSKALWNMIGKRQPTAVVLRNADPVCLQVLLKHHPSLTNLSVSMSFKDYMKKAVRTICLFKQLEELEIHIRGGNQVEEFRVGGWVHLLRNIRKVSLSELGGIADESLPPTLTHLTLCVGRLPDSLNKTLHYLTFLEIRSLDDTKFSSLSSHLHNLRTCVFTGCNCTNLDFPVCLLSELRVQGSVSGRIQLQNTMKLEKVHFSLKGSMPECQLPSTVTQLSLRGTASCDPHWLLGLSIACTQISKIDLRGFTLKSTIASSLGMRFPKVTHLNIIGCVSPNTDHMYLIAILQDARHLTHLSCSSPYSCHLTDLRAVFPHCYLTATDYKLVLVSNLLPPLHSSDVVIDMGDGGYPV